MQQLYCCFGFCICMSICVDGFGWGFYAHKKINRMACYTLPIDMLDFYKPNIDYLTSHAVDADKRRYVSLDEGPRHYIDLDHYCMYPCDSFPKQWHKAIKTYSEDTLRVYGVLPWHILGMMKQLEGAFKRKDAKAILKLSADIGHYVADAHVPLHTTINYNGQLSNQEGIHNGQLSNQEGIHGLWESRLPELFARKYDFFVHQAEYISRPNEYVWQIVLSSHQMVDSVLQVEKELSEYKPEETVKYGYQQRNNVHKKVYTIDYAQHYHMRLKVMVERQMRYAIWRVGSVWFTCWVNAGRPRITDNTKTQVRSKTNDFLGDTSKKSLGGGGYIRKHAQTSYDNFD